MDDRKIWKTKDTDKLFEAILSLKSIDECERFFRDLMTLQEIETFAGRFKAARLLEQGVSYRDVYAQTGVSTATVTRVSQWLNNGMDGYKLALSRVKSKDLSTLKLRQTGKRVKINNTENNMNTRLQPVFLASTLKHHHHKANFSA